MKMSIKSDVVGTAIWDVNINILVVGGVRLSRRPYRNNGVC